MRIVFKVFFITTILMLTSCKSKKIIIENTVATPMPIHKVIKNYHQNIFDQKTVKARIKVDYNDGKSEQSFTANLRMEKDKIIWITATVFGIPVVKVLITPDKVSYYEKLNGTYFEGDFKLLSDWLGTELNFQKIQNLLVGQALSPLNDSQYEVTIDENSHLLRPLNNQQLFTFMYWINPQHFRLNKQMVLQLDKNQYFTVTYPKYEVIKNEYFPSDIIIDASDSTKTVKIEMEYKAVDFNETLTFPFEIPDGYKLIQLN